MFGAYSPQRPIDAEDRCTGGNWKSCGDALFSPALFRDTDHTSAYITRGRAG